MSPGFAKRTKSLTESKTFVITAAAARMIRHGIDVVNLSAGEPDFNTPDEVKEAGCAAIRNNFTRYTASQGIPELREQISGKLKRDNELSYHPDQIVVTSGAKHALAGSLLAVVDEGDEVLYPKPGWLSYPEMARIAGGVPKPYPCRLENRFRPDPDELRRLINRRTKAIITNSPGNPTGAAFTPSETRAIGSVLAERDIWVLSDEIYEKLRFDGEQHLSFANVAGLFEKTVLVNGVSKAFRMTGWRIGYLAAVTPLAKAVTKVQSQMTSSPCSISQQAAAVAIGGGDGGALQEMVAAFVQRRDIVVRELNAIEGVSCPVPEGAFYALADVSAYLGGTVDGRTIGDDIELCQWLLDEMHLALVPGKPFGADGFIRISFAAADDRIREGMRRLREGLARIKRPVRSAKK